MKKIGKILLIILLAIIIVMAGIIAFLTITEYKPEDMEDLELFGVTEKALYEGSEMTVLTYNIGYGGLSADMDLYTEGGEGVTASTSTLISKNLDCIRQLMKSQNCDVLLLQSVDQKANRSFEVDEVTYLTSLFPGMATYAPNYNCKFIPLPISSPLGSIDSGLLTIDKFPVTSASRLALKSGYSWPMKLFEPKNCLEIQRVLLGDIVLAQSDTVSKDQDAEKDDEATEDDEKDKKKKKKKNEVVRETSHVVANGGPELIVVNVHFEALDNGDIKIEQTKALANFVKDEYAKGNYIIIGGTFNQTFPGSDNTLYPLRNTTNFMPGILEETLFGPGWSFAYDEKSPTARLLNTPYNEYDPYMQCYVIDGFICSPNISVLGVYTIDTEFKYSNHQPVRLRVKLAPGYDAGTVAAQAAAEAALLEQNASDGVTAGQQGPVSAPGTTSEQVAAGNYVGNGGFIGQGVLQTDGTKIYGTN